MSFIANLREVNIARDAEWDSGGVLDASFFAAEMAGEVGEAIEAGEDLMLTKGIPSTELLNNLAEELADVVICIDLLAIKFGITLTDPDPGTFDPALRREFAYLDLAIATGKACNVAKKLERERLGLVGSRSTVSNLAVELGVALYAVYYIAWIEAVNLDAAVALKFNKTSDKCGLATKMAVPA